MRTIYKETLTIERKQLVHIHKDAKLLSVQMQNGLPQIWMEVDTSNPVEYINIWMFGTGHGIPIDFKGEYIATFQDGNFVFHVYKERRNHAN